MKPSSSISKESIEAPEVVHVGEEKFASSSKEKKEQNDKQNEIKQPESKEGEANSMWYKGKKLDSSWLILSKCCLKIHTEMKNKKRRQVMTCELCKKYEEQIVKFSVNGRLPVASGVRIDIWSTHNESKRLKEHEDTWRSMSTDHPWVRMIEKHKKETLEFLLRLAVDVYNDCRAETLSARSWPSRSLSFEHSNNLMRVFQSEGWDADFFGFEKSSFYHYRDPVTYAEMRNIVVKFEMEKVAAELKNSICYSLQIDGSSDKQQIDSKFITARYVPIDEVCVKTVFLGVASSDRGGAAGLLDSLISCLESVNVDTEKLVGVTTDG